ncbi:MULTISPECIES: Bug family tripartite tricarboxylate transporter substrate binding protein [Bordetella]|uniref:ABC transporter substrate-binding protein n=2 Tax=Bordetella TaxID=517 RepID=A0A261VEG1_9BORD|nr:MULTISPECIES: tripartite tricarboxylate transporter substrate binding protein [Bordetella]MDM9560496.1 tripartite tricarboxylate transporter substrate binding protein [Bordetella petrii]OZI72536.1 ABC transporter substrate-binding protein [Bordetella genomosp. 2]
MRQAKTAILAAAASLAAMLAAPAPAASAFPSKPVRIIAPSSAGGILDLTSRLVGEKLSQQLGSPVVVENMAGGGGIIGMQGMLNAAPDGHTLVMGSLGPNAANYSLYSKLPYQMSDFAPVIGVISMPSVLVVNPKLPVKDLASLQSYAKSKNGDIAMAISTMGASSHLIGEVLKGELGISAINVVYKGAAPAITDLVGGQVDFMVDNMITAKPMIEAGRLRAIAVFSKERSPLMPDVPTVTELGYPQLTGGTWLGLFVSAKTPPDRVERLNAELNKVLADPGVRDALVKQGGNPVGGSSAEFDQFVRAETERWRKVIQAAGIKVE